MGQPNGETTLRWIAGMFITAVLGVLGSLGAVVMRHEGAIGRWEGRLDTIERTLERMEIKLDQLKRQGK